MLKFRTPHPSSKEIALIGKTKKNIMVRHGASKKVRDEAKKFDFEINSIRAINQSANKDRMKELFAEKGVKTTESFINTAENREMFKVKGWNIVYKTKNHRRGIGMEFFKLDEIEKLTDPKYQDGLIERRINVRREWRIHICPKLNKFYALEKRRRNGMVKVLARNIENCVFRENFEPPQNWDGAIEICRKAVEAVELDVGAVDLAFTGKNYYVIEVNSGAGLGDKSRAWYQGIYQELVDFILK